MEKETDGSVGMGGEWSLYAAGRSSVELSGYHRGGNRGRSKNARKRFSKARRFSRRRLYHNGVPENVTHQKHQDTSSLGQVLEDRSTERCPQLMSAHGDQNLTGKKKKREERLDH